jgi:hypothetical protein
LAGTGILPLSRLSALLIFCLTLSLAVLSFARSASLPRLIRLTTAGPWLSGFGILISSGICFVLSGLTGGRTQFAVKLLSQILQFLTGPTQRFCFATKNGLSRVFDSFTQFIDTFSSNPFGLPRLRPQASPHQKLGRLQSLFRLQLSHFTNRVIQTTRQQGLRFLSLFDDLFGLFQNPIQLVTLFSHLLLQSFPIATGPQRRTLILLFTAATFARNFTSDLVLSLAQIASLLS